jgi:hypothetical protein
MFFNGSIHGFSCVSQHDICFLTFAYTALHRGIWLIPLILSGSIIGLFSISSSISSSISFSGGISISSSSSISINIISMTLLVFAMYYCLHSLSNGWRGDQQLRIQRRTKIPCGCHMSCLKFKFKLTSPLACPTAARSFLHPDTGVYQWGCVHTYIYIYMYIYTKTYISVYVFICICLHGGALNSGHPILVKQPQTNKQTSNTKIKNNVACNADSGLLVVLGVPRSAFLA